MRLIVDPERVGTTTHAWERYCQRVGEVTKEEFDAIVFADPRVRLWLAWGAAALLYVNGLHIYADGRGNVTTVLRADQARSQAAAGLTRARMQRKGKGNRRRPDPPMEAAE